MRLDQIETLSASKLNQSMLESIGWNFRGLKNLSAAKASAMLESINNNIAKLREQNLYESQSNANYNGLLLARRVLEAHLAEYAKKKTKTNEISPDLAKRYTKRAKMDRDFNDSDIDRAVRMQRYGTDAQSQQAGDDISKLQRRNSKRQAGINRAKQRMASEAAKPDYLDLDGDGNRKEPMKKAAADRKKTSAKIDEISRDTARSYIRKAAQPKTGEPAKKDRTAGIERAGKKAYGIGGEPRVRATEGAKRAVEPGAVATAQVKKMGPKYWTGDKLTKPGITKRDEIIAAIEKDQGVNEAKRTHAQVRKELDRVNDRIEKIVKDGGRVPLNDPLSKQLRDLKSELKSLKESRLHARLMEDSITNAEAIMAAQDMVDRIQGMLEDVGQMINEEIPPLTDSIRGAIGAPQSDQFKSSVTGSLNSLMEAVRTARESMEGAVRALSGEAPAPMSSADTDSDEELDIADLDSGDGFDASDAATGGDLPLGRAAR